MKINNLQMIIRQLRHMPTGIIVTTNDFGYIGKLIEGLKLGYNQLKGIKSLEHRINDVNDSLEHLPFYLADIYKHTNKGELPSEIKKYFDTHLVCFIVLENNDVIGVRINNQNKEVNYDSLDDNGDSVRIKMLTEALKIYVTLQKPFYISTPKAVVNIDKISKEIFNDIYMQLFTANYNSFKWIVEEHYPNGIDIIEMAKQDGEVTVLINSINTVMYWIVEERSELNLEQNGVKELIEVYLYACDSKVLKLSGL